jgi:aryl-alcohol dehydrogenase-like predicted oxidoreductase
MQYGSVPGVGDNVSRLVLGSMVFSTDPERYENTCALLDAFVEAGGTTIDTARVYGRGSSEKAFGQWLKDRGIRDRLVVIGKGAHHDSQTFERRVSAAAIHEDITTSLDEMQLDTIDIYLLHKDDPEAPVGPIVEALNEEVRDGRIKAFGGCWTHERIAEANEYAQQRGLQPFTASSPNMALAVPNEPMWVGCVTIAGEAAAQEWYRQTNMPIFAWSSQARGFFSGRYSPEVTEGATTDAQNVIRTYYSNANWERYNRADQLAKEKGATRSQIVLAWVLGQPLNLFPLIGPATVSELADSLGALRVNLTPDEVGWLNLERERAPLAAAR